MSSEADDDLDAEHIDHTDDDFSAAAMGSDGGDERAVEPAEPELDGEQADDAEEFEPTVTSVEGIDWAALWQEFGFDTPDANGNLLASRTQLEGALDSSEQDIGGDVGQYIDTATERGEIDEITVDGDVRVGYQHEVAR